MTDFTYQLIALLPLPNDGFTSFTGFLRYNNLSLDLILKFVYMGDDTNQTMALRKLRQSLVDKIEFSGIQASETFIYIESIYSDTTCIGLNLIR